MAHHEIQALANVTAAPVTLEYKLSTLEQQRRLRGMFLGSKLIQTTIQVFGDTQVHGHPPMVPKQYQQGSCSVKLATPIRDSQSAASRVRGALTVLALQRVVFG